MSKTVYIQLTNTRHDKFLMIGEGEGEGEVGGGPKPSWHVMDCPPSSASLPANCMCMRQVLSAPLLVMYSPQANIRWFYLYYLNIFLKSYVNFYIY